MRTSAVMDHFGIDFEQDEYVVADGLELPITSGNVVLFSGESGSGKSSMLRAAVRQLSEESEQSIIDLDQLDLGQLTLIDALSGSVDEAMNLLSMCGLGEAHLMLRTPQELSDGQRSRFRLALAVSRKPHWIVADEFTATLDRTLAKIIAYNVRRLATRTGIGFLLATTHEDVVDDLAANVHVTCSLDGEVTIATQVDVDGKKKVFHSTTNSGSPVRPDASGHTSLGGITAATISVWSNSSRSCGTKTAP
ncbi:MAG: hypothetical protein R3C18_19940 [Planctomycetaceae bacterium]